MPANSMGDVVREIRCHCRRGLGSTSVTFAILGNLGAFGCIDFNRSRSESETDESREQWDGTETCRNSAFPAECQRASSKTFCIPSMKVAITICLGALIFPTNTGVRGLCIQSTIAVTCRSSIATMAVDPYPTGCRLRSQENEITDLRHADYWIPSQILR